MNQKKKVFVSMIIAVLAVGLVALACSSRQPNTHGTQQGVEARISYYTCSMHPQVHRDEPGDCPICGMKLVPVYEGTSPPVPGSFLISPEKQQLIGVKTVTARRQEVAKGLRTVGRVAFDPALAIAQREYLEIAANVPSLKEASRSRLRLLGMGEEEIRELEKKGKVSSNLYLPKAGEAVWVYATLYQGEMDQVSPGSKAEIRLGQVALPSGGDKTFVGTVRAIDPVVDPVTRSVRARIEVAGTGESLRPDTYVDVVLKTDLGEALTIPRSAVVDTGVRKVAFVVHDGGRFQARDIKTGPEVGDDVVVLEGIEAGEAVVATATFLVDSESQLQAAVSGMGEGHQH